MVHWFTSRKPIRVLALGYNLWLDIIVVEQSVLYWFYFILVDMDERTWMCLGSHSERISFWYVIKHLPNPEGKLNPLTPRVKPWVTQSVLSFDSMDRTLKCDH